MGGTLSGEYEIDVGLQNPEKRCFLTPTLNFFKVEIALSPAGKSKLIYL